MEELVHTAAEHQSDIWSDWLLHLRHGDDAKYGDAIRSDVEAYADRVLDGARLTAGMTLADIGCGDGLVAFRALERIGDALDAILVDISAPLLRHAREQAQQRGLLRRCQFFRHSAERLEGIGDATVDVVTTRSVLAYVADKSAALREFHRILKPGGRISIAEPILRDEALMASAMRRSIESQPADADVQFLRLLHRWKAAQYPDTQEAIAQNPMTNYSERDLLQLALNTGFTEIHLETHIDVLPAVSTSWDAFLGSSPHPLAPTTRAILNQLFSAEERLLFEHFTRPLIEQNRTVTTNCMAYLHAVKP